MTSSQKSYLFPSLMIRTGTLLSSWACWTHRETWKGHVVFILGSEAQTEAICPLPSYH
jgi:hypothetical protein